ncbi:MAG TPA: hypothetical protein VMU38_02625 [Candidatus Binatia bacterium]|nr:hypothetical protein [Candidatus Binatia bacterium]
MLLAIVLAAASAIAIHLPVTTNSPQAQAAVDRGLFLYYAFNGEAAAKAFAQAAEADPRLAMAYWGIALADGPDLNTPITEQRFDDGAAAIAKAATLVATASPSDRRYVETMALRYRGRFSDFAADDAAYRSAMLEFARSSNDENAELLAAEALLEFGGPRWLNGAPASDDSRTALELVTAVLRDDRGNVMANHLCIHIYDLAPDRAPARPCAQRLDADAFPPEAEHLAHMPAHYWIETGDYAAALASSERAYELIVADGGKPERYLQHDVSVGYAAAMMLGDYGVAQLWAGRMTAVSGSDFGPITALRFGRYDQAYAAATDAFASASVRGIAALHLGKIAEARALAAQLPPGGNGYMEPLFRAQLAESEGKYDDAERWIEVARARQRAQFEGENIPLFPADEALRDLRQCEGTPAQTCATPFFE